MKKNKQTRQTGSHLSSLLFPENTSECITAFISRPLTADKKVFKLSFIFSKFTVLGLTHCYLCFSSTNWKCSNNNNNNKKALRWLWTLDKLFKRTMFGISFHVFLKDACQPDRNSYFLWWWYNVSTVITYGCVQIKWQQMNEWKCWSKVMFFMKPLFLDIHEPFSWPFKKSLPWWIFISLKMITNNNNITTVHFHY